MPKTEFEAFGTVVTSAFCQKIYGGSRDTTIPADDPQRCGHKHDGIDEDGHCAKIGADEISDEAKSAVAEVVRKEFFPLGVIMPYAGTNAPDGYLFCDGQPIEPDVKYNDFREWIRGNATHLIGEDRVFRTPNLCGRTLIGAGTQTDDSDKTQDFEIGDVGGEYGVVLGVGTLPYHTHRVEYITSGGGSGVGTSHASVNSSSDRKWLDNNGNTSTDVDAMSIKYQQELNSTEATTKSAETDEVLPHNNLQPYYVVNYIIRATR